MLNEYRKWLINKGYATVVNNKPSTVYDYCRSIKFVLQKEGLTIQQLADSITSICPLYQKGNSKEILGRQISRSVRNSLKQFLQFVSELNIA